MYRHYSYHECAEEIKSETRSQGKILGSLQLHNKALRRLQQQQRRDSNKGCDEQHHLSPESMGPFRKFAHNCNSLGVTSTGPLGSNSSAAGSVPHNRSSFFFGAKGASPQRSGSGVISEPGSIVLPGRRVSNRSFADNADIAVARVLGDIELSDSEDEESLPEISEVMGAGNGGGGGDRRRTSLKRSNSSRRSIGSKLSGGGVRLSRRGSVKVQRQKVAVTQVLGNMEVSDSEDEESLPEISEVMGAGSGGVGGDRRRTSLKRSNSSRRSIGSKLSGGGVRLSRRGSVKVQRPITATRLSGRRSSSSKGFVSTDSTFTSSSTQIIDEILTGDTSKPEERKSSSGVENGEEIITPELTDDGNNGGETAYVQESAPSVCGKSRARLERQRSSLLSIYDLLSVCERRASVLVGSMEQASFHRSSTDSDLKSPHASFASPGPDGVDGLICDWQRRLSIASSSATSITEDLLLEAGGDADYTQSSTAPNRSLICGWGSQQSSTSILSLLEDNSTAEG